VTSFKDLPLLESLQASLAEQSLTRPTEIQARTVPDLLAGASVVGVSETGSGKTLAFVLPMLQRLKTLEDEGSAVSEPGRPRGLVLVPGRELGEQVSKVFKSFTHGTRLRVRTVLGGAKKKIARRNVEGNLEILVATPGRLIQLLDARDVRLDDVRILVFDEADQMLDPGFLPVARRIVGDCPRGLQLVLFSATMPQTLDVVVRDLFREKPLRVQTKGSQRVVPTLQVENRSVPDGRRFPVLAKIFDANRTLGTLMFANTRAQCDRIAEWLYDADIPFAAYMGQMDRLERRKNLARFRNGDVHVLLATDLGGRGLDIDRVERVINVHMPQSVDNYLHRVGRTARAGREGLVINLVTQRDEPLMAKLRKRAAKQR
jgi:ATP-dependent RNA helicase RhlE